VGENAALEDHAEHKGGPSKQGCEGCHGPGADHVAGGGDKTKIFVFEGKSRQETSARCLSCHGEAHEQSHFAESAHASSDVGCLDCHSPHHAKGKEFLLVQEQPQLCYGCHTSAKADFAKPYHHRVNEGLVQCVTATTRTEQPPCGSYAACPAATPFATSAMSTSRVRSSTSTCR
jgi:DmsE family decaheme c-type cytochrome